jgi:hypothetical protein
MTTDKGGITATDLPILITEVNSFLRGNFLLKSQAGYMGALKDKILRRNRCRE